jgi:hypothetical protein
MNTQNRFYSNLFKVAIGALDSGATLDIDEARSHIREHKLLELLSTKLDDYNPLLFDGIEASFEEDLADRESTFSATDLDIKHNGLALIAALAFEATELEAI